MRRIRLLIIAVISFLSVTTGGTFFNKIISIFLCGVINLNSAACYAWFSDRSQANPTLPPATTNSALQTEENSTESKTQLPNFLMAAPQSERTTDNRELLGAQFQRVLDFNNLIDQRFTALLKAGKTVKQAVSEIQSLLKTESNAGTIGSIVSTVWRRTD